MLPIFPFSLSRDAVNVQGWAKECALGCVNPSSCSFLLPREASSRNLGPTLSPISKPFIFLKTFADIFVTSNTVPLMSCLDLLFPKRGFTVLTPQSLQSVTSITKGLVAAATPTPNSKNSLQRTINAKTTPVFSRKVCMYQKSVDSCVILANSIFHQRLSAPLQTTS